MVNVEGPPIGGQPHLPAFREVILAHRGGTRGGGTRGGGGGYDRGDRAGREVQRGVVVAPWDDRGGPRGGRGQSRDGDVGRSGSGRLKRDNYMW